MSLCFLWKNRSLFLNCFFWGQLKPEKIIFKYYEYNKVHFSKKKWSFKKVQNIELFQRVYSMLFVKKSNFFSNVFLGTSSRKRSFLDILSGKDLFLDQKRELLKKSKKLKSMLFVKKLNFFSCVFLCKSSQKRSFLDIPNTKEWFLSSKQNF